MVINHNLSAMYSSRIEGINSKNLQSTMEKLSSGERINSAKDDAAGTVISARMNVQLEGNQICQNNIQNANSLLSTAEGNIDVVLDNVTRIRDLTLQAKSGTYSTDEIGAMQKEVKERLAEIDRVSNSAKFSQLSLFEDDTIKGSGITFQVGQNADATNKTDNVITANQDIFGSLKFSALTKVDGAFNLAEISSGSYTDFNTALTKLDSAITNLTGRKSLIGSAQARLTSALDTLTTQYTNLSSAKSIITDSDIASEASKFTQNQILQQVSTSLLAQANQAPSVALSLV